MKKIILAVLISFSIFSFAACGTKGICAVCGEAKGEQTVYEVQDDMIFTGRSIKLCSEHKAEHEQRIKNLKDARDKTVNEVKKIFK